MSHGSSVSWAIGMPGSRPSSTLRAEKRACELKTESRGLLSIPPAIAPAVPCVKTLSMPLWAAGSVAAEASLKASSSSNCSTPSGLRGLRISRFGSLSNLLMALTLSGRSECFGVCLSLVREDAGLFLRICSLLRSLLLRDIGLSPRVLLGSLISEVRLLELDCLSDFKSDLILPFGLTIGLSGSVLSDSSGCWILMGGGGSFRLEDPARFSSAGLFLPPCWDPGLGLSPDPGVLGVL
mmetsp:Transcript_42139/g.65962  ORF Transcript_42139/g.65962 Transcript_42139/m.65962 type:complete len:238 (-) Transcript_42139:446-1159(-)